MFICILLYFRTTVDSLGEKMFCTFYGAQVRSDANFCENYGNNILFITEKI